MFHILLTERISWKSQASCMIMQESISYIDFAVAPVTLCHEMEEIKHLNKIVRIPWKIRFKKYVFF